MWVRTVGREKNLQVLNTMIGEIGDMNWLRQMNHRGLVWLFTPIYYAYGVAIHSRCILVASTEVNLVLPSSVCCILLCQLYSYWILEGKDN